MNPLRRFATAALVALLFTSLALPNAHAVTIDMVTVGNPGNANDTGGTRNGAVNYEYQIGKYDVTIGQYTAFLNAADPNGTNPNGIYNASMATDLNIAGIRYTAGASAGAKYSVINNGGFSNRPIVYVSWFDAARFANWMTNGQGNGSTETGAYTLNNATTGPAVAVNPGAAFRLPTTDEWYKAAYYSPNYGGVGVPGYFDYATKSDTAPGNNIGPGTNQANYFTGNGFSLSQWEYYESHHNYLTGVGAFSGSGSFYGTFDQSGNVFQWNDLDGLASSGSSRGLRGGNWDDGNPFYLSSSYSYSDDPSYEGYGIGFRLASPVAVPEPSTWVLCAGGLACTAYGAFRRRKHRRVGRSFITTASLALAAAFLATNFASAVTIDWVTVGNPNNPANWNGYGSVANEYRIAKYEVTIQQYTDFLNAADPNGSNPYGIYDSLMSAESWNRGISFSNAALSGHKYGPIGTADRPIVFVNWFNAARFANWMHNGQGVGSTETGAYTLGGITSGSAPAVNPGANIYIPTANQWFKAAYYSPVLNSGTGGYFYYATQSNTAPGNIVGNTPNQANYYVGSYPNGTFSVTQTGTYGNENLLTAVGSFTNSASYYGTFDQSGSVVEWNDGTGAAGLNRGLSGGGYSSNDVSQNSMWSNVPPSGDGFMPFRMGFRLASPVAVPEPSTWVMGLAGIACGGWQMYRRRRLRHTSNG